MANKHATLKALFTDTADAIREKSGDSATIVADTFPDAIRSIPAGGGGGAPNGTKWLDSSEVAPLPSTYILPVAFKSGGIWLGGSGSGPIWSEDGIIWHDSTNTEEPDFWPGGYATAFTEYRGAVLVSTRNNGGGFWYSDSGKVWTRCTGGGDATGFCSNGSILTAIGLVGVMYSEDGKAWTTASANDSQFPGSKEFTCIATDGKAFVAGSAGYGVWHSETGKEFTKVSRPPIFITSVMYHRGIWTLTASKSKKPNNRGIWWSSDGKAWTNSDAPDIDCYAQTYMGGKWVAVTEEGVVLSENGKNWATVSGSPKDLRSVTESNGVLVATSGTSGMWYSTDGSNWVQSNVTNSKEIGVFCKDGLWVAAGSGKVYYSPVWEPPA